MVGHKNWDKRTWQHPLPHDFQIGFGLGIDDGTKNATMVPICFSDNAIVDYETIKVNIENEDFAVSARPNCAQGSYVPNAMIVWQAWSPSVEIDVAKFSTIDIHTSMLERLTAFDKKSTLTTAAVLELQSEATDEQCGGLYDGTKLYEGHGVRDAHTDVPFLTTNGQMENIVWSRENYFDALHYFGTKSLLRKMSSNWKNFQLAGSLVKDVPIRDKVKGDLTRGVPSICKFMNPYAYYGKVFTAPAVGDKNQLQLAAETSAIEHISFEVRVRFNEFNPDFNFSRA